MQSFSEYKTTMCSNIKQNPYFKDVSMVYIIKFKKSMKCKYFNYNIIKTRV